MNWLREILSWRSSADRNLTRFFARLLPILLGLSFLVLPMIGQAEIMVVEAVLGGGFLIGVVISMVLPAIGLNLLAATSFLSWVVIRMFGSDVGTFLGLFLLMSAVLCFRTALNVGETVYEEKRL